MAQRRTTPRYVAQQRAFIGEPNGPACLVSDFSATGARLCGTASIPIPDRFDLLVLGLAIPARVVWRAAESIGVIFEGEPRPYEVSRLQV